MTALVRDKQTSGKSPETLTDMQNTIMCASVAVRELWMTHNDVGT